jgi:FMN phosphatase YigB (HAD superfamily)
MTVLSYIFDIEDVFFDGTFYHRSLHQMICKWTNPGDFATFQRNWQQTYLPEVYSGTKPYWDALASFFVDMRLDTAQVRELITSAQCLLRRAQGNLRPLASVDETLKRLKRSGHSLNIVCNSIHEPARMCEMLARIGLPPVFDYVLTSFAARRVLPDREAFAEACERTGHKAESTAYVSTRPVRLQAARDSGFQTVRISPIASLNRDSADTYTIRTFAELDGLHHSRPHDKRVAV